MGASASVSEPVGKEAARAILGDRFDEHEFDRHAGGDGRVSPKTFNTVVADAVNIGESGSGSGSASRPATGADSLRGIAAHADSADSADSAGTGAFASTEDSLFDQDVQDNLTLAMLMDYAEDDDTIPTYVQDAAASISMGTSPAIPGSSRNNECDSGDSDDEHKGVEQTRQGRGSKRKRAEKKGEEKATRSKKTREELNKLQRERNQTLTNQIEACKKVHSIPSSNTFLCFCCSQKKTRRPTFDQ